MAAESAHDTVPATNGIDETVELTENGDQEESQTVEKPGQPKISAAEKRRQRKKKNKQAKQLERLALAY